MYPFDMTGLIRRNQLFNPNAPNRSGQPNINPNSVDLSPSEDDDDATKPAGTTVPSTGNDIADVYSRIINAKPGPAQQRYRDFLENEQPDVEDYKPTKMARLSAILAGINDNFNRRGRGQGAAVTEDELMRPYQNALSAYELQGKRLGEAANVEEKDISNRVKTYRDILQDQQANRRITATEGHNKAQEDHWKAQDAQLKSKGYTKSISNLDGHIYYTKVNDDGTINKIDGGPINETAAQGSKRRIGEHSAFANIDLGRQKNYFDYTDPKIQARQENVIDYRNDAEVEREAAKLKMDPASYLRVRAKVIQQMKDDYDQTDPDKSGLINTTTWNVDPSLQADLQSRIQQALKPAKINRPSKNKTTKTDPRIQGVVQ